MSLSIALHGVVIVASIGDVFSIYAVCEWFLIDMINQEVKLAYRAAYFACGPNAPMLAWQTSSMYPVSSAHVANDNAIAVAGV